MTEAEIERPTVLVIEDDADITHILGMTLAHAGFDMVSVGDGLDAIARIREMPPPRLVLLDVMLPRMDGMLIIPYIRNRPGWEEVPIVMLTAKAGSDDVFQAINSGANSYITKPFDPMELMARLRTFLN